MTDIQRLQLKYERGLRCIYNGISLRGVILGIKKKSGKPEEKEEKEPEAGNSFSDYGYDEVNYNYHSEQLEKDLRKKNKQYTELQIEHDQLKADFEALKKKMEAMEAKKSPVKSVIDDSDDEVEETKTTSKNHKIIKAIECDE